MELYKLLDGLFHQLSETVGRVLRVDVLNEFGNNFSIGFRLEFVSFVFQELLNVLVVGDNSCQFERE